MQKETVLAAKALSIDYQINKKWYQVVNQVDLSIKPMHIHGLVGESGSGKSTLGLGLMQYMAPNARVSHGSIEFEGIDLVQADAKHLREIWGSQISLVPQNPLDSLNPSLIIQEQMTEITRLHGQLSKAEANQVALEALQKVKIADPERILKQYPHQLSGGMQQRVIIAMALSTGPRLLILDEPTTALDVTTQAVILELIRELVQQEQSSALYISHNLGTIAQLCDDVSVMYSGEIMESAPAELLFNQPIHPYTIGLLASLPARAKANRLSTIQGVAPALQERPKACVFAPRCPIAIDKCHAEKPPLEQLPDGRLMRCWRWQEIAEGSLDVENRPAVAVKQKPIPEELVLSVENLSKTFQEGTVIDRLLGKDVQGVQAVDGVQLNIHSAKTVGLVGESGSGKTSLARCIVGLYEPDTGEIKLKGKRIEAKTEQRDQETLANMQMVFQNPNDALNPYITVGDTITRTLKTLSLQKKHKAEIKQAVLELLESVGLTEQYYHRYPNQLSGGEKQRVAIARAFAASPSLIVADEPTSSLDVSVQAVILNLLKDLRAERGASYLFITHDLDIIRYLADWVVVMYLGQIVEQGPNKEVHSPPMHPYTEALLSAIPIPDPSQRHRAIELEGDIPSPQNKPSGCPFHTRCPRKIGSICETEIPPERSDVEGHRIVCHIPLDELESLQLADMKTHG